jgi:hypothetical protein
MQSYLPVPTTPPRGPSRAGPSQTWYFPAKPQTFCSQAITLPRGLLQPRELKHMLSWLERISLYHSLEFA